MSRQIDLSGDTELSEDDVRYLRERNALPSWYEDDVEVPGPPEAVDPFSDPDSPPSSPQDSSNDPSIPDLEDIPYEDWPKDELKKELEAREIEYKSKDTVAILAAKLVEDDEAETGGA